MNGSRAIYSLVYVLSAIFVASCGAMPQQQARSHPLTADEILARAGAAHLTDAHVTLAASYTVGSASVQMTGEGVMVLHPAQAVKLSLQSSGPGTTPGTVELVAASGRTYQRLPAQAWTEIKGGVIDIPWLKARQPTLLGEESTAQGPAWHLRATSNSGSALEIWIRKQDGYPLRVATQTPIQTMTLTLDRFNTGATVSAPTVG